MTIIARSLLFLGVLAGSAWSERYYRNFITVGPMLHCNFGKTYSTSWAMEIAYWNYELNHKDVGLASSYPELGNSIDLGIEAEFSTGATRLYTEYQRGFNLHGFSVGPVVEWFPGRKAAYGVQGSYWGAAILGADIRLRSLSTRGFSVAPGVFAKFYPYEGDG